MVIIHTFQNTISLEYNASTLSTDLGLYFAIRVGFTAFGKFQLYGEDTFCE